MAFVVACMFISDVLCATGMRYLSRGNSVTGTHLLAWAERFNSYSFNLKANEIETLFAFYRGDGDPTHLQEASTIAQDLVRIFPGSAQAAGIFATATTMEWTHMKHPSIIIGYRRIFERAIAMDPISVVLLEDYMFFLAAHRYDYARYRQLGIMRTALTQKRLIMQCALDGKSWLEHK